MYIVGSENRPLCVNMKITDPHIYLNLIGIIILLVGLGGAAWIYITAGNDANGVLGYEIIGGQAYSISPEDSKMYRHDLELFGGKAAVFADQFNRWFAGLWHRKSLAFIVAFIAIFTSLVVFYFANRPPLRFESDIHGDNH